MYYDYYETPVGKLLLAMKPQGLSHLHFENGRYGMGIDPQWKRDAKPFVDVHAQLDAYFEGTLTAFDLPLAPTGTPFQQAVWRELLTIAYGDTTSYGDIARRVADVSASRAVGAANGQNPISIIVPCHRVVGANGTLTGYGGGLPRKKFLLDHEQRHRAFALTP
jgi:methylated-DNA-[protein]-cysteine S-methyltransferase